MTDIAIIGCGLGGSALSVMMQNSGYNIQIFERAHAFERMGAGIHLSSNLMYIMEEIGVTKQLEEKGWKPDGFVSRDAYSNDILNILNLGNEIKALYGVPYLTIHRSDFHESMVAKIRTENIHMGKKLVSAYDDGNKVHLQFEDGSKHQADLVIGADGLASVVKNNIVDTHLPTYTGQAAFRGLVDVAKLHPQMNDNVNKWFGRDKKFIIGYYLDQKKTQFYYVAGFSYPSWPTGLSLQSANKNDVLQAFDDFHDIPKSMLALTNSVTLWPLHEREPSTTWKKGRLVLIGDACHPMRPHMMSGASMAIEDAAVLVKCLKEYGLKHYGDAFEQYQNKRSDRTALVQKISSANTWLKEKTDTDWLFKYNALEVAI